MRKHIPLILVALLLCPLAAHAFSIPEKLSFDLQWTGISAGKAELEVRENGKQIQLISKATSAEWISYLYPVNDLIVSSLRKENARGKPANFVGSPQNYRAQVREGRHRRDKEFIFDQEGKRVTYINHVAGERRDFPIGGMTFDPLSSFFYLRTIPLETGKSVYINLFDNKKVYPLEVKVLKRETIETKLGAFRTIVVKPILKSEGIFSRRGDILIWLTDDEKRLPVQVKTRIAVGSVKATLVGGTY